jgi:hypothetical protein
MGEVARSFQMREALQGSRTRLLPIIDYELGDVCFCVLLLCNDAQGSQARFPSFLETVFPTPLLCAHAAPGAGFAIACCMRLPGRGHA